MINPSFVIPKLLNLALIGAYGILPGDGVDIPTMERIFNGVGKTWRFNRTWCWDFLMLTMCAAKLGHGEKAIDYLLSYPSFKINEHGLVGGRAFSLLSRKQRAALRCCDDGRRMGRGTKS